MGTDFSTFDSLGSVADGNTDTVESGATLYRYPVLVLSLYWTWLGDAHDLMTGLYLGNGHGRKLIDL